MSIIRPEQDSKTNAQKEDRFNLFCKELIDGWKKEPREWATVHKLKKKTLHELHLTHVGGLACDDCVARHLAWEVFFKFYVLPYLSEKEI